MLFVQPWRFLIIYCLLALAAGYVFTRAEAAIPVNEPLSMFPQRGGDWIMTGEERFDARVLELLLPTDYISRRYQDSDGNIVSMYIGFHDGGPGSGPIHSPRQCLPGSGWSQLNTERRDIVIDGISLPYVGAVYQKDAQKLLFLYWYQVRNSMLTNEYALKYQMLKNSFLHNRRDAAFVRLSVAIREENYNKAIEVGENFMHDFVSHIHHFLPQ